MLVLPRPLLFCSPCALHEVRGDEDEESVHRRLRYESGLLQGYNRVIWPSPSPALSILQDFFHISLWRGCEYSRFQLQLALNVRASYGRFSALIHANRVSLVRHVRSIQESPLLLPPPHLHFASSHSGTRCADMMAAALSLQRAAKAFF